MGEGLGGRRGEGKRGKESEVEKKEVGEGCQGGEGTGVEGGEAQQGDRDRGVVVKKEGGRKEVGEGKGACLPTLVALVPL